MIAGEKTTKPTFWQYSRPAGPVVFDFEWVVNEKGLKRFLGNFAGILKVTVTGLTIMSVEPGRPSGRSGSETRPECSEPPRLGNGVDALLHFCLLCRPSGSSWQPDVLLKSHPIGPGFVPFLEREPIRFKHVADLCRIVVKNVFEDRYQHT